MQQNCGIVGDLPTAQLQSPCVLPLIKTNVIQTIRQTAGDLKSLKSTWLVLPSMHIDGLISHWPRWSIRTMPLHLQITHILRPLLANIWIPFTLDKGTIVYGLTRMNIGQTGALEL